MSSDPADITRHVIAKAARGAAGGTRPQLQLAAVNGYHPAPAPAPAVKPLPGRRLDIDLRALERQARIEQREAERAALDAALAEREAEHSSTRGDLVALDAPTRGYVVWLLAYLLGSLAGVIGVAVYAWLQRGGA